VVGRGRTVGFAIDVYVPGDFEGYDNVRLCEITPRCAEDFDWDWDVGFSDLLAVLTRWGSNGCGRPEDLDRDCDVDFDDLLILLAAWGPCE